METWIHRDVKTWRHGDMDMETWIHGDVKTWRHGYMEMETWKHRDMEAWRHGDMETWTWTHQTEMENGSPGDFLNPFSFRSSCKRKIVVCLFVDEETNRSYPFANELNGLAHL